jgi:site-specific recombinase XerD
MNVNLFLKRPKDLKQTAIYANFSFKGVPGKYYLPNSTIYPKDWDGENRRVKKSHPEHARLNQRLRELVSDINSTALRVLDESVEKQTTAEIILRLDKIYQKGKDDAHSASFWNYFTTLIERSKTGVRVHPRTGKPISPNTVKTYNTTLTHLQNFRKIYKKRKIDFATIDVEFHKDFTAYLTTECKMSANAIGKHFQIIKAILREATEEGINTNMAFTSKHFFVAREDADNIYLSWGEIDEWEALDLSNNPRLDRARDWFLIGCHTAQRVSDFLQYSTAQIIDDCIAVKQEKTSTPVRIPLHTAVKKILKKYDGFPPKISDQKLNSNIKDVAKLIPSLLTKTFAKTRTKAGKTLTENFERWKLVTTHTARRSFATNHYIEGLSPRTIMAFTGHKSEKVFYKYIKITPDEHIKILEAYWTQREQLKKLEAERKASEI